MPSADSRGSRLPSHHVGSFVQSRRSWAALFHRDADKATIDALEQLGHKITPSRILWHPCLNHIDANGRFKAAGDLCAGRHAAAF
jgi:hypothetical protein